MDGFDKAVHVFEGLGKIARSIVLIGGAVIILKKGYDYSSSKKTTQ